MCILLGIILMHFAAKYSKIDHNETQERECAVQSDGILYHPAVYGELEERKVG